MIRALACAGLAGLAVLVQPAAAQPARAVAAEAAPSAQRTFLAMRVRDAEAAAAWYMRTFDLRLAASYSTDRYRQRILSGERLIVELIELRPASSAADPAALGYAKGGFSVDDFDGTVARWRAAGVPFLGRIIYDEALNLHVAAITDPDGNMIQIFGRSAAAGR